MTRWLNLDIWDLKASLFLKRRMTELVDLALEDFQLGHGRVHRRNGNTPRMLREKVVLLRVLHSTKGRWRHIRSM